MGISNEEFKKILAEGLNSELVIHIYQASESSQKQKALPAYLREVLFKSYQVYGATFPEYFPYECGDDNYVISYPLTSLIERFSSRKAIRWVDQ